MKWKRSKKSFTTPSKSDNQSEASMNQNEVGLDLQNEDDLENLDDDSDIDVSDDADMDIKDTIHMLNDTEHNVRDKTDNCDPCVSQMNLSIHNFNVQDVIAGRCNMPNFSVENKLLNPTTIS